MSFVDGDVDLGGFANVVHRHDVTAEIGIGISFTRQIRDFTSQFGVDFAIREGDLVSQIVLHGTTSRYALGRVEQGGEFTLVFDGDPDNLDRLVLDYSKSRGIEAIFAAFVDFSNKRFSKRGIESDARELEPIALDDNLTAELKTLMLRAEFSRKSLFVSVRLARPADLSELSATDASNEDLENVRAFMFSRFLDELLGFQVRRVDNNLREIRHLAGLRVIPDRFSSMGGSTNKLTADASNIVTMLGSSSKVVGETSKWLSRLTNGAYELEVVKMNGRSIDFLGDVGSLVLRDKKLNTTTTFKDVGVGLSQVLPIIAALVQAGTKRTAKVSSVAERIGLADRKPTLLLEQPELHLHPRMQAELADLLIEQSMARSAEGPQVIMETHSESIILRMQRRIREGMIPASSVSVLYVDRDPESGISRVKVLPLDDNGEFLATWPEDFGVIRLDEILP